MPVPLVGRLCRERGREFLGKGARASILSAWAYTITSSPRRWRVAKTGGARGDHTQKNRAAAAHLDGGSDGPAHVPTLVDH